MIGTLNTLELFNIWSSVDSLKTIYQRAEELAKKRKTTVDNVFENARFDPIAYQMKLTGTDEDTIKRYENAVLERMNRRNTTLGKVKNFFSIDPLHAPSLYIPKGICPVSGEEYELISERFLRENSDLVNIDESQSGGSEEKSVKALSKNPIKPYLDNFGNWANRNKRKIGAVALASVLLGGAAVYSYMHGLRAYQEPEKPVTCEADIIKLTSDFNQTVKDVMKDLHVSEGEMKLLNEKSSIITNCMEGKDVKDIKVSDPIETSQVTEMVNAYLAHYSADPNDQAKLESIKLLPEHSDSFLSWLAYVDKSKLDYETQIRLDLIYNDVLAQKQNNTLDLYDVVVVSKFIQEKSQSIETDVYKNLQTDLEKIRAVNESTTADMKYLESVVLVSDKTEDSKNFQTIKVLTQAYYDYFPTMKQLSEKTKITYANGTEVEVTELPLPPSEKNLDFGDRFGSVLMYEGPWFLASTFGSIAIRYLVDRRSHSGDSSFGYGFLGGIFGVGVPLLYDLPQTAGTQEDFYRSMLIHSAPLFMAGIGGLANRVSRWNSTRHSGYCGDMSRARMP